MHAYPLYACLEDCAEERAAPTCLHTDKQAARVGAKVLHSEAQAPGAQQLGSGPSLLLLTWGRELGREWGVSEWGTTGHA